MPLDRYADSEARFLPNKPDHIRFDMISNGKMIAVDLPIKVMLSEFGKSPREHLAHFNVNREVIELTVSEVFDKIASKEIYIQMKGSDFENRKSRSLVVSNDRT